EQGVRVDAPWRCPVRQATPARSQAPLGNALPAKLRFAAAAMCRALGRKSTSWRSRASRTARSQAELGNENHVDLTGFGAVSMIQTIAFDFGRVIAHFDHGRTLGKLVPFTDMPAEEMFARIYGGELEDEFGSGRARADGC